MFGLSDRETGEPITDMTKTEYVILWALAFLAARFLLVQPIIDAIHALK